MFGDELTLVITAFPQLARVKRHGHQRGARGQRKDMRRAAKNFGQVNEHVKSAMILELMNQRARRPFEQNRGASFFECRHQAFAVRAHAFHFNHAIKRMTAGRTVRLRNIIELAGTS